MPKGKSKQKHRPPRRNRSLAHLRAALRGPCATSIRAGLVSLSGQFTDPAGICPESVAYRHIAAAACCSIAVSCPSAAYGPAALLAAGQYAAALALLSILVAASSIVVWHSRQLRTFWNMRRLAVSGSITLDFELWLFWQSSLRELWLLISNRHCLCHMLSHHLPVIAQRQWINVYMYNMLILRICEYSLLGCRIERHEFPSAANIHEFFTQAQSLTVMSTVCFFG